MIEPLDLKTILVNTLSGNIAIFGFISFIFIAGMAAYFKMPNIIAMAMFLLFIVLLGPYLEGIYALAILLAGIITFWSVSRIIKT